MSEQRRVLKVPTTLLLLLVASVLCASPALACSLVSVEASTAQSITMAWSYAIAAMLIGAMVIGLEIHRRRWSLVPVLTAAFLVFHPAWTVPAKYMPDCTFINVYASQVVLAVILALFGYRIVTLVRSRKRPA